MAQRKAKKGRKSGRAGAKKRPARKAAPKPRAARSGKKGGAKKSASSAPTNARVAQLEAENRRLREELASLRRAAPRAAAPAPEPEELGEPTLPFGE
jgi:hypothetical protein